MDLIKEAEKFLITNGCQRMNCDGENCDFFEDVQPKDLVDFHKKYNNDLIYVIEQIMERWHLIRYEDEEALKMINSIMFKYGFLKWHNKKKKICSKCEGLMEFNSLTEITECIYCGCDLEKK